MRLFIAEKPNLAKAIANGLGNGRTESGCIRCGDDDVVAWCFGHMLELPGVSLKPHAPRNFGVALVALGMVLLTLGIIYHLRYMRELRAERTLMKREGLIHGESHYPVSLTLITAGLLWVLGLLAIAGMTFNVAPFG